MTALDEVRNGSIGEDFIDLLQKTIRAVAVARNFPPPEGHKSWGSGALITAVNDFLASPQISRRLSDLATHCRTEDALRQRLQTSVRNHLADQGRRTPVGRLVLRFNDVLGDHSEFVRRGSHWASTNAGDTEPSPVDPDALATAIRDVEVTVPTVWATGDRQSPDLDAASVVRLAAAMLYAAGGPLRTSAMAQAAARRLGLWGAPLSLDASFYDPPEQASISNDSTSDDVLVSIRAQEVLAHLNDHERVAIGRPEVPVDDLGSMLGMGKSKAALVRNRAKAILKQQLAGEEGGEVIAEAVLDLARRWTESWTK